MLGVLGVLTLGIIAVLPAKVLAVESGILKACVGPPSVEPLGVGVARRGDQITCGIEVVNVKPSEGSICITSTLDLFMGDPASCTDQGCQCVGGSQNAQPCSGTAGECPPPGGLNPGTCALLGRDTGVADNLLDAANNEAGIDWRRCVASDGTAGTDPCTQASDCGPGETCCALVDTIMNRVSVVHVDEVRSSDPDPLKDNGVARGIDLTSGLPFTLQFRASVNILSCEETSPLWDPQCGGDCPPPQICTVVGPTGQEACVCVTPCADAEAPMCEGTCPPPQVCSPDGGGGCECSPPDEHYKCYKTRQIEGEFPTQQVSLEDQFAATSTTVRRPHRFCNPVDKNNEGINDPTAHLMCYDISEPKFEKRTVVVENQFGQQVLTVRRPETLCVPAEKDMVPSDLNINHFKCYKVTNARGAPTLEAREVVLEDQFETKTTIVFQPRFLCTPVDKNGEGIHDPAGHLTCYRIKDAPGQPGFERRQVIVGDQFTETQPLNTVRGDCRDSSFLCVPSTKHLP